MNTEEKRAAINAQIAADLDVYTDGWNNAVLACCKQIVLYQSNNLTQDQIKSIINELRTNVMRNK